MHWSDLFKPRKVLAPPDLHPAPGSVPDQYIVRTVGVQLRGPEALAQRLQERAGVARNGAPLQEAAAADALLLVSGSHALRPALSWTGALQDSKSALQIARKQREHGCLPKALSLWAVSNPLRDSPDSVLRKVDAGAEVLLTQPPLLNRQFEAWYEGLSRSGVMEAAHVVIGGCMLTSARSADFWLRLCGARHLEGAEALIAAFVKAEAAGKAALQQHSYEHAKAQIRQALELPAVAGMHVMPVSKAGRRLAMQLVQENVFQR
ncbi:g8349 [Coccomyxa viridis]|uniref:G8349 protein n=1 Tax=Coccomyxa viridis TaxID=1274662 RepID=A0ABP1G053_9CHLO